MTQEEGQARIGHVTAREVAELRGQLEFDFWSGETAGQRQQQEQLDLWEAAS